MKKLSVLVVPILIYIFFNTSCTHMPDPEFVPDPPTDTTQNNPCSPDTVYFQNEVLPLIVSSCAKSGCHDAATKAEKINLSDYNSILRTGGIKVGNPNGSEFIEVITETRVKDRMPPSPEPALSATQIELLKKWISQGAKNLACNANLNGCDTSKTISFQKDIMPVIELNCKGCHSAYSAGGGVKLTNYTEVKNVVTGGVLIGVMDQVGGFKPMPPAGNKVDRCNISKIKIWIRNGAPNN